MSSCERCWEMAQRAPDIVDEYMRLVRTNDCTPEQQAGRDAAMCPDCGTRTVHQHTHSCICCGKEAPDDH